MVISRNSWHARVYCWFVGDERQYANLCPYVRTVFLWAPIRFCFGDGKIGPVYVGIVTWTLILAAIPATLYATKGVRALTAALVTYGAVMLWGCCLYKSAQHEERLRELMTETEFAEWKRTKKLPERLHGRLWRATADTRALVAAYFRAIHDGICPTVEIRDTTKT